MWRLARSAVAAHPGSLVGTLLALVAAAALLSAGGVLVESGLRTGPSVDGGPDGATLVALASSYLGTALVVVVLVVAATVVLAMRPRQRDLAVLRAVGATHGQVRRVVTAELLLLAAVAGPVGSVAGLVAARWTTPLLVDASLVPAGFTPTVSPWPALSAVLVLGAVAVVAGRLAARDTLRLPPTAALRSTLVEPREVGRVRRTAALGTAVLGLVAAGSPLVVPGTVGGATAATSAMLLVGAAALAGPLLVQRVLASAGTGARRSPVTRLALAATRGSARRLTAVVVPLATVVAVGTVQTSTGEAVHDAAVQQLTAGISADLVVTAPDGLDDAGLAAVSGAPGVTGTTPVATVPARVRTDDEDVPGLESLSWESAALRVLAEGTDPAAYDPDVVDGSLAALDEPGTVAVSTDARLLSGAGTGETVAVRVAGGGTAELRVAAVYDRGLGFGDYTVGTATTAALGVETSADTVLVDTDDAAATTAALDGAAIDATTTVAYVASATSADAAEQRLSTVLLLALLAFVLLGAGNALVMSTVGRRDELRLLGRIGATRPQLVRMAFVESLLVAVAAVAIGTLAVVPAVLGTSFGLLGAAVPALDVTAYGVLLGLVLVVSVAGTVPTVAARVARP
ncbi:FtsX-like permease family protein [Nocardioides sp. Arc9.136]|uniref:FtsX-like permease family protein n=1 Tax=Nocardioides sp. Arc9.136 TaxID=2996826 RepID=UPI002666DB08|nr:FtsX-like permease family protein [Nocardioides sp. Arc9.136]WKN48967.1 FtsX-like permease family protein [Nocardioides sp. Arc9.136]